ncbi:MAG TPA: hypothetical protein VMU66_04190 [Gaiellales bacterium]|nr:hypothetical protein [Gaiellales bacterium]
MFAAGTCDQLLYGCAWDQLNATLMLCTPLETIVLIWPVNEIPVVGSSSGPSASTPTKPCGTGVDVAACRRV